MSVNSCLVKYIVLNCFPYTVEPRYNEWPRDWQNWLYQGQISIRFTITGVKKIVRSFVRFPEDFVIIKRFVPGFVISRFHCKSSLLTQVDCGFSENYKTS